MRWVGWNLAVAGPRKGGVTDEKRYPVFNASGNVEQVVGEAALEAILMGKTDATLRIEAAQFHQGNMTNPERHGAALAMMELERRSSAEAKNLAMRTTWISAIIGVLATVGGVLLGVWLSGGGGKP